MMKSLSEAGMFSPKSSQVALPMATNGSEPKKPNPLARAELW